MVVFLQISQATWILSHQWVSANILQIRFLTYIVLKSASVVPDTQRPPGHPENSREYLTYQTRLDDTTGRRVSLNARLSSLTPPAHEIGKISRQTLHVTPASKVSTILEAPHLAALHQLRHYTSRRDSSCDVPVSSDTPRLLFRETPDRPVEQNRNYTHCYA